MKDILIEIDRLAEEELERANKIHPMFHSNHEEISTIRQDAQYAAAELIQVIAMCDKFIKSQEVRNEYRD